MPIKKKVNKEFFTFWSPTMAYVLGFFFADGSYDINQRGSEYFSFQITDQRLLHAIRTALGSDHRIATRKARTPNESDQYRLQIGSKHMCLDLRKLGVSTQKSHTMNLPAIPAKYLSDFVRGYFDGDGNVWSGHVNKKRHRPVAVLQVGFTSASETFLLSLFNRLKAEGLLGGGVYCKKSAFCLKYSTSDAKKLHKIMYHNMNHHDLCLQRKKVVFDKFIYDKR